MRRLGYCFCKVVLVLGLFGDLTFCHLFADDAKPSSADSHFTNKVKPLLTRRCIACHGEEKAEGGLRLDTRAATLKGGESGPAAVVGKPAESLLLQAVEQTHEHLKMPPKERLSEPEVATLSSWIRDGLPWPAVAPSAPALSHTTEQIGDAWTDPRNPVARVFGGQRLDLWSLKAVRRPELPTVADRAWPVSAIDRFVLARIEAAGITPPPSADPRTLARRLYFDLTGLAPTNDEVAKYAAAVEQLGIDSATDSLVETLLSSSRFGEHWARLWLDVVRYSDSNGFDWDEYRPQSWRFRDYVIRSLNADKPFDQFIREQLAGDELLAGPPQSEDEQDSLIATGFLRLGPHDNAAGLFDEQDRSRAELLADVTETTGGAFLGLTLSCCRCHDHKYDPLLQADHYRFRAFFAAMKFADDLALDLADAQAAIRQHNEAVDAEVAPLKKEFEALKKSRKEQRQKLTKQIEEIETRRRAYTHGLLMTDRKEEIPVTAVLFQGDHKVPRDAVEPAFLSIWNPQPAPLVPSLSSETTGRRLTLANWIASPDNPFTARVFVNRVWTSLMGQPLVATPNDFGLAGATPSDPELLDWLASEFMQQGWSIKTLIRQIATSAAYRQRSSFNQNHFHLRQPRRLTAEQLRDATLQISGLLTAMTEGPAIWPDLPQEVLDSNPAFLDDNALKVKGWYPSPKAEQYARSLFLIQKRNTRIPILEAFDLPDNSTPCARRNVSTVAPQAMTLMNSPLAVDAAHAFSERLPTASSSSEQVQAAFRMALQRDPLPEEQAACERLLKDRGPVDLCRVLLNLNEFAYID
jgi:mono/diheme cytochrome c family protein